jgi:hypothetical protein
VYLGELIAFLEARDPAIVVPMGFHEPHSYRGDYFCLAFEPLPNTTVGAMLACAREALGKTYQGYKGGDYVMKEYTNVYLSEYGTTGEEIGPILLQYMVGEL